MENRMCFEYTWDRRGQERARGPSNVSDYVTDTKTGRLLKCEKWFVHAEPNKWLGKLEHWKAGSKDLAVRFQSN